MKPADRCPGEVGNDIMVLILAEGVENVWWWNHNIITSLCWICHCSGSQWVLAVTNHKHEHLGRDQRRPKAPRQEVGVQRDGVLDGSGKREEWCLIGSYSCTRFFEEWFISFTSFNSASLSTFSLNLGLSSANRGINKTVHKAPADNRWTTPDRPERDQKSNLI